MFVLAFVKVNGVPIHFFILNLIQTFRKPRLRVWDKEMPLSLLRDRLKPQEEVISTEALRKGPMNMSRMEELSLIVNTGGAYRGEEHL